MCNIKATGMMLLIIIGLIGGAQARELRFDQALKKLKTDNEANLAANAEEQQAQYRKKAATGLYFPKIGLDGRYTRINKEILLDLNDIRTVIAATTGTPELYIPSFEIAVQDETFLKYNVNFTWPIFTGGKILAANRAADANISETQEKTRELNSSLISDLVKRYYGVRLASRMVEVRKQVLDSMQTHLDQAKKLQKSGMIALSEKLHAEVTWSEADREYKKAKRTLDISQAALNSILSSKEDLQPVSKMFVTSDIAELSTFQNKAVSANPLLNRIEAKRQQARQNYEAEKSEFFPTVYLFGKHELNRDDLTILEPEWAAGVGFTFNLFSGLSSLNRVGAARQLHAQVGFLEKDAQRKIHTLVEKKYNELMASLEQYEATETSFKFANEYVRVRNKGFDAGMSTSIDVVDARLALSRVQIERLKAAYEFDVALAELLEASGMSDQFEVYRNNSQSKEVQ